MVGLVVIIAGVLVAALWIGFASYTGLNRDHFIMSCSNDLNHCDDTSTERETKCDNSRAWQPLDRAMILEMPDELQIHTIWKTTTEQCEVVWNRVMGYHTRLWVRGQLVVDEMAADIDAAVTRALELRASDC